MNKRPMEKAYQLAALADGLCVLLNEIRLPEGQGANAVAVLPEVIREGLHELAQELDRLDMERSG